MSSQICYNEKIYRATLVDYICTQSDYMFKNLKLYQYNSRNLESGLNTVK